MSEELGRLDDLPSDYLEALQRGHLMPLWPSLRAAVPPDRPARKTQPALWRYRDVREQLLRAGDLAPIEKAERRVLVLCNPGLPRDELKTTASIYVGMQLIYPGELAPNHLHTPAAIRFAVEGNGGFTVVRGEKLPMQRGDLILTPPGLWHEHGHDGEGPVVWLDVLDLPVVYGLEASYSRHGPSQVGVTDVDLGRARYGRGGLVPYQTLDALPEPFPQLRFAWSDVRQALLELGRIASPDEPVHLAYVNAATGRECLPTIGCSAMLLRPAESQVLQRRSASAVFHLIEGRASFTIDGDDFPAEAADTLACPTHARVRISNPSRHEPAFLFMIDDAPLQRRLGIFDARLGGRE